LQQEQESTTHIVGRRICFLARCRGDDLDDGWEGEDLAYMLAWVAYPGDDVLSTGPLAKKEKKRLLVFVTLTI
jgi:hypothetical protein